MLAQKMHAQGSLSASVCLQHGLHDTKPPYLSHLCAFDDTAEYSPDRNAYTAQFGTVTNEHKCIRCSSQATITMQ